MEEEEEKETEISGYRRQSRAEDRLGPISPPIPLPVPHVRWGSPSGQFGGQLGEEVGGGAGPPSGQGRGFVG